MTRSDSEAGRSVPCVLAIFPSTENRAELLEAIASAGMAPKLSDCFEEAMRLMENDDITAVICEDQMPQAAFEETLKRAHKRSRPLPVIVASRTGEWEEFLKALGQGAFDYLALPPRPLEVKRVLGLALGEASLALGTRHGRFQVPSAIAKGFTFARAMV